MNLLERIKSILGLDRQQPATAGEPGVTVEREPVAESERAVKGSGAEEATTASSPVEEAEPGGEPSESAPAPPVDEIDGIGPTYAERLTDAGIETVADLAASDIETVAEAAEASPSRVEDWIEQARRD